MAEPAATGTRPYQDRQAVLVLFGILEILFGLFFLFELVAPSLGFDLLVAVCFIWLGIGSILARRWARALLLVTSWTWLLCGLVACLTLLVVFLPDLLEPASQAGGAAASAGPETMMSMQSFVLLIVTLFFILLPLGLVIFYRGSNVKATCEARDPKVRWTDRCPTPVLGMSLLLGLGAVGALSGISRATLPVFGRTVSGTAAIAGAVVLALFLAGLSRATYRLRPWAWWAVLVLTLVVSASSVVTLASSISWLDLHRAMGVPAAQLERLGLDRDDLWLFWFYLFFMLAVLGYLVWVKRYFRPAAAPTIQAAGAAPGPAGAAAG
jgi:hypothetical protein